MITEDVIKTTSGLEGLTAEQVNIITTLSKNDEQSVVSTKYREMHDAIDTQIKELTGLEKNGDKTTDFLKRALTEFNNTKTAYNEANKKIGELNEQIKAGSADKEIISRLELDNKNILEKYNAREGELAKVKEDYEKQLFNVRVSNDIYNAMSGLKFKDDLSEFAIDVLKESALMSVMRNNPEYIDGGNGKKVLAFKDGDGSMMRNPDNKLNPFTAKEMLVNEFKKMGVLHDGNGNTGGGGGRQGNGGSTLSLSSATTKAEALAMAEKMALDKGLTRGSVAYQNELAKIWQDNSTIIANLK